MCVLTLLQCLIVILFVSPPEKVTVPVHKEMPLKTFTGGKKTNKQTNSSSVFILITSVNNGH